MIKFWVLSLIRVTISAIWRISVKNIKILVIISSIFSNRWIIISIIWFRKLWLILFLNYLLVLSYIFIIVLNSLNDNYIYNISFISNFQKLIFLLIMIIIGGLPPFIIFFLKIRILFCIILSFSYLISLYLILLSVIIIYIYIQYRFYILRFYRYLNFKSNNELLIKFLNPVLIINFIYVILILCIRNSLKFWILIF